LRGWGLTGFALAAVLAALGLAERSLVADARGDAALLAFVPFVAGVAWLGGWSALLPARASLAPADARELYALTSYALGSAAVIALLELARRRGLARARERGRRRRHVRVGPEARPHRVEPGARADLRRRTGHVRRSLRQLAQVRASG
jgi:hypothetical protein